MREHPQEMEGPAKVGAPVPGTRQGPRCLLDSSFFHPYNFLPPAHKMTAAHLDTKSTFQAGRRGEGQRQTDAG